MYQTGMRLVHRLQSSGQSPIRSSGQHLQYIFVLGTSLNL